MSRPVLRVENVSKRYVLGEINRRMLWESWRDKFSGKRSVEAGTQNRREHWALRDVSFEVKQGDVLAVMGGNGAGKSTLLKILSRITAPTSGRLLVQGRIASLLEVGTGFHPELTGRDNVFLNGTILGMTRRQIARRFDEIVDFAGVDRFIDTPVKRYSMGMRVRLAFAVAAYLDPEILMIDEVLAVGDAEFQKRCIGKIGDVAHSGRTVLFVSHDAAAIAALCTRGLVLSQGRTVFEGTQTEAIRFYAATRATAGNDLRGCPGRAGTGELQVVGLHVRDGNGQEAAAVRSGDAVEFGLVYERCRERELPRMAVQMVVTTYLGAPVFTQATWLTGAELGEPGESGEVVLRIPRLPLPSGHFRLGYRVYAGPQGRPDELVDGIESAVDLHVEGGDFFSTGKLPSLQQGVCLVEGQWRVVTTRKSGM
jgi:lipopolysaccharide transport system ATP-binding protein